jgi:DNA-binding transcriptional LysR family regulator
MLLFREPFVLTFGTLHRFSERETIELEELNKESYCSRTECEFLFFIERLLAERNVELNIVHQTSREEWVQAFVRSNFGVAFMPLSTARRSKLNYAHVVGEPIVREVRVLWHSERALESQQQAIVDILTRHDWKVIPRIGALSAGN